MSKFEEHFSEPISFTNGTWVISGMLSRDDAAKAISDVLIEQGQINEQLQAESLTSDRVRYGFAPEDVEDLSGELCWYSGATGKGSMPVWVYE